MADANSLSDFMKSGHIFAPSGNGLPPQASAVALGKALSGPSAARLPSTQWATADGQGIDPALAYGMGSPGANQGPGPVQAIDKATSHSNSPASFVGTDGVTYIKDPTSGHDPYLPGGGNLYRKQGADLVWENSNPAQAPSGDPWAGMRQPNQPSVPQQGMTTGNTGRNIASYLPSGSPISGLFTGGLGGMFANTPIGKLLGGLSHLGGTNTPSATPSGLAALPAGAGYLQALGQNTGGSAGQVSNAFRDALASSSRQSGSGPGSQ